MLDFIMQTDEFHKVKFVIHYVNRLVFGDLLLLIGQIHIEKVS